MKTAKERLLSKISVNHETGCWIWTASKVGGGYGCFHYNRKNIPAHRAAYNILVGVVPVELEVCHKCDVRLCVNPEHLFLGTHRENMQDCIRKGRANYRCTPRGFDHVRPMRKLTDAQVLEIASLRGSRMSNQETIARFGITSNNCRSIWRGESWGHITGIKRSAMRATGEQKP